jgi:hypothetical protein
VGNTALSPGERVDRDGALTSRRGPGEGLLPLPSKSVVEVERNQIEAAKWYRQSWTRNSAAPADARAGLSISPATKINWRSTRGCSFGNEPMRKGAAKVDC